VKVYDEKTDEEKGEFQAVWNAVETNGWSCKSSELFNSEGGYWELGGAPGNSHGIFYEPPDGARARVFTLTHTKGPANPSFFSDEAEGIGWQQKEGGAFPVLPDQGGGISFKWKVVGYAREQIAEVSEGLDVLALADCDQSAQESCGSPTIVASLEKPIAPPPTLGWRLRSAP
jgi:hypothetical protein